MERCNQIEVRGTVSANMSFLETARKRCAGTPALQLVETCLSGYQNALVELLLSEILREAGGMQQEMNGEPAERIQRVIADAENFEQSQRAQAAYLEELRRLKTALGRLYHHVQMTLSDEGGT
jgi:hypothetical protein